MVYLIKNSDSCYKIGYSKNPCFRLKQLFTANSSRLVLYKTYHTVNDSMIESYLHAYFKYQNVQGEWYHLTDEDLLRIDEIVEVRNKMHEALQKNLPVS